MIRNKRIKIIPYITIPLLAIYLISRGNLYDGNLSVNTNNFLSYFLLNCLSIIMGFTYFKTITNILNKKLAIINSLILILSTIIPYKDNLLLNEIHVMLGYVMVFGMGAITLLVCYKQVLNGLKIAKTTLNILLIGFIFCGCLFISFGHVNSIIEIVYILLINTCYFAIEKA